MPVLVQTIGDLLPFAATVARQEVVLFVPYEEDILILGYANYKENQESSFEAQRLSRYELPLWDQVLREGNVIKGYYERRQGVLSALSLFPIVDNGGKVIAALAFINSNIDSHNTEVAYLLAETTSMAVLVPQADVSFYKPLSYQDGIIIFDDAGSILYANETAIHLVDLLGFDRRLIGASIYGGTLKLSLVKEAMQRYQAKRVEEIYGDLILEQTIIPAIAGGKMRRNFLLLKDKTSIRKQEQALLVKNSVIKEIHHRVKNNLQTVAGLLRMQSRQINSTEAKLALQESISRIESMALVHDTVAHYDEEYIELRTIAEELIRLLRLSMLNDVQLGHIIGEYIGEKIILSAHQATYVSLVLNELISNTLIHGFKGLEAGRFEVRAKEKDSTTIRLAVIDNGHGLPTDFEVGKRKHLGLQIILNLVENELHGSMVIKGHEPSGTEIYIEFKRDI